MKNEKLGYDVALGVSVIADLKKENIELDFANLRLLSDLSNNEIDFCYDDDVLLKEPLSSEYSIYECFLSSWNYFVQFVLYSSHCCCSCSCFETCNCSTCFCHKEKTK